MAAGMERSFAHGLASIMKILQNRTQSISNKQQAVIDA